MDITVHGVTLDSKQAKWNLLRDHKQSEDRASEETEETPTCFANIAGGHAFSKPKMVILDSTEFILEHQRVSGPRHTTWWTKMTSEGSSKVFDDSAGLNFALFDGECMISERFGWEGQ